MSAIFSANKNAGYFLQFVKTKLTKKKKTKSYHPPKILSDGEELIILFPLNRLIIRLIKRLINYGCKVGGLPKRIVSEQKGHAMMLARLF